MSRVMSKTHLKIFAIISKEGLAINDKQYAKNTVYCHSYCECHTKGASIISYGLKNLNNVRIWVGGCVTA